MTSFRSGLIAVLLAGSALALPLSAGPHGPRGHQDEALPLGFDDSDTADQHPAPGAPLAVPANPDAKEGEKKEDKWDVNNPPGPSKEATIDVTEGTWMSLDVSPDGKEIAFDLLGDLYTIPIGGGEAKALTHDVAWQMQPRYSPDGRYIAFTSDQGGGENIWVMNRDGSKPQQVTKETYRLLNGPAWTPDSQFIVARKHFTSQRSLGAGEMWLYHRTGGDGLQMTKKPNDQKDVNEPVFSPDGRYLYYSQDVTPGQFFEYNKDSNTQIYVIQRLDRRTGETAAYVTGPGGAVRPTPSPDGKRLAFVRRVRGKSVLHLKDVKSGEIWPVYDGLDRDMQEAWAIHGVYPIMAWTPDSRSLVFWAGGKIRRLDASATGSANAAGATNAKVTDIPFHVRTTRKVAESVRYPVEVAPDKFDVKMLRWVEVSPKGDRVLYGALGQIWVKELPKGEPRRLTRQNDHFEFFPSFSRDGRWVVYTTWDDRKLGTVRVVSATPGGTGEGRVLTDEPGHYIWPVFSPDGKNVVYRRIGGGFLRTTAWSEEPGIYRVSAEGRESGPAERISEAGMRPHFGDANDRVYLIDREANQSKLLSVGINGKDPRTHVTSENALEFRVSPDGRWVAFTERFNAYIAPFVTTGQAVEIGPKTKAVPVSRASKYAGEYLHWSGDSKRLYWSLGPELFSRDLKDSFSFLEGALEKLPDAPEKGIPIGFQASADVPTGTVAVVGARIVTMKGDEVIEDGTVVIERNRIRAVGPRAQVQVPGGAHVIDAKGKTVIPGLVEIHFHGGFGDNGLLPEQNWNLGSSLSFGVTTIHDPSNDTATTFSASELQRTGRILGPRTYTTGTVLYGATSPTAAIVDSLDDARAHLRRLKAVGAVTVKSYNQPRREQRQQFIAAARELEMMVVPEGGSLFHNNMTQVVDGHTGVEHNVPQATLYQDVLQLWSATEVGYTPTLVVSFGGLSGEYYWYQHTNVWDNQRLLAFVPREDIDERSRRPEMAPEEEYHHIDVSRQVKKLFDRGVSVQIGGHGQREGLAPHWETWMLVQGGMTPHEALRSATLAGAQYIGLDKDLGSIEPGKLADLVILDANPLEDIRNSETVGKVILNGRVYDGMTLDQQGNHPKKREPYFWQLQPGAFANVTATP